MKGFHYKNNKDIIETLDIFCATKIKIKQIANFISLPLVIKGNYIPPTFLLFDNIDNFKVRALIAVGMGCDVYPAGVKSIGPQGIHDIIQKMIDEKVEVSSY